MASAPDGVDPAAWAALLKWSIAQTAEGDGTSSEPPAPLSKEKKEFLEAVMKDGVVDLVKRAGEILEALHEGTKPCREGTAIDDDATDRLVGLMEELMDIVEQIDFAMALVQVGGWVGTPPEQPPATKQPTSHQATSQPATTGHQTTSYKPCRCVLTHP
mmetsp:Transcript_45880/g.127442  ORF Transcript_45880/g.127442 Transcript_45880/m.127442 type:complete len:159 (-) Transcript_45880:552-1028(-)